MIGDKQKGVTLIEMIVAATVFAIIFAASSGVFVSAIKVQKYNLNQHQLMDQTAYAMEYMSRFLRMAIEDTDGRCTGKTKGNYGISPDGKRIQFRNYHDECLEFFWDDNDNQLKLIGDAFPAFPGTPLTSDSYEVTNLEFFIEGDNVDMGGNDLDSLQPRVTIFLEIQGKDVQDKPKIKLQTTVSQRNLDR